MKFTIISSSNHENLSRDINEKLAQGWTLHGHLLVTESGETRTTKYVQAMVKVTDHQIP
jgi:hypothetical protein